MFASFFSFLLGRKLLKCGECDMDAERRPITVASSDSKDYEIHCKSDFMPLFYPDDNCFESIHRALERLPSSLLANRCNDVFERYWDALSQHNDIGALMLQVVFEILKNEFFQSDSQTHDRSNVRDFRHLIKDELESIDSKLRTHGYSDKDREYILNRIRQAPSKSIARETSDFIEALGVVVTKERRDAIDRCNGVRHGSHVDISSTALFKIYWSYINEVISRMIGLDVNLVDHDGNPDDHDDVSHASEPFDVKKQENEYGRKA